ncbi:unnamed protein product [Onchocerca flexuosa]|uniref:Secreted protein n=1 Tax=Onchocerca flexuosa TaxID=387005 RepID=A0A183I0R8_9BILA|nr:unnamed protein product [Onchocerca flexuosa]
MFKFLFGLLDNISGSLKVLQAFNSPILSQSITAADHTITTMKLNEKIMLVESKIGVMQKSYSMRNDAAYVDLLLLKQQISLDSTVRAVKIQLIGEMTVM